MRLIDKELEGINNDELLESMEKVASSEEKFLLDKGFGNEISKRKDELLILFCSGNYNISINGIKKSQNIPQNAAALCRTLVYDMKPDYWHFENGIVLSKNNSSHNICHELFHGLSKNTVLKSENNIFYDKTGVKIIGYNNDGEEVDETLNADFLNEGITEMLTNEFCNEDEVGAYPFATYIAMILTTHSDKLLQAYFSKERTEFKQFLNEFNIKQNIISKDELVSLNSKSMLTDDEMYNLVNACVMYRMNSINSIEEKQKLTVAFGNILEKMDNDCSVNLNNNKKYCNTINIDINKNK